VATIFLPIRPDLPIPEITTRPVEEHMALTSSSKEESIFSINFKILSASILILLWLYLLS